MNDKANPLESTELSFEENANMIDGILNNIRSHDQEQAEKPLDRVRPPTVKKRNRDRER